MSGRRQSSAMRVRNASASAMAASGLAGARRLRATVLHSAVLTCIAPRASSAVTSSVAKQARRRSSARRAALHTSDSRCPHALPRLLRGSKRRLCICELGSVVTDGRQSPLGGSLSATRADARDRRPGTAPSSASSGSGARRASADRRADWRARARRRVAARRLRPLEVSPDADRACQRFAREKHEKFPRARSCPKPPTTTQAPCRPGRRHGLARRHRFESSSPVSGNSTWKSPAASSLKT